MEQAFYARDLAGTLVQVGVPTPDMRIDLPMIEFFGRGGASSPAGTATASRRATSPCWSTCTCRAASISTASSPRPSPLDGVEEAFHRMERGEVLRSVVGRDGPSRDRARGHDGDLLARRAGLRGREQHLARRRRRRGAGDRRRPRPPPDRRGRRGRRRVAIVATHGHNDHINAAGALADALDAPVGSIPTTSCCGRSSTPTAPPDGLLVDGMAVAAGRHDAAGAPHPGSLPRRMLSLRRRRGRAVLGRHPVPRRPRGHRRSYSDFPTIIESIRNRLLMLPGTTRVLTGHGDETTIGAEAPHLSEWLRESHG